MGNCASVQDRTEKERSDEIDRMIEEDSRRFRKECKILLLGQFLLLPLISLSNELALTFALGILSPRIPTALMKNAIFIIIRIWRIWQIHDRQTDENHPPKRVYS